MPNFAKNSKGHKFIVDWYKRCKFQFKFNCRVALGVGSTGTFNIIAILSCF